MKWGIGVRLKQFSPYDATDRSKIRSDQKCLFFAVSLYPLLFFANTPFKQGPALISIKFASMELWSDQNTMLQTKFQQ